MGQIDTDGQTDGCSVGECPPQEHNNSLRLAKSPTVQLADNEVNSLIPDVADSSPSSGTTGSPMPVSISQIEHFRRIRRLDFVFGELTREREFIYQVHNIDHTHQLSQWQAASGGISPSLLAAHNKKTRYTHTNRKKCKNKKTRKINVTYLHKTLVHSQ